MSGQVLSADAIAALVDAAREGRLPEDAPTPQRRRRMRAVDFTRPTKFTADQERRLRRTLEAFCRTASKRISAELRVPLELELLTSTQLTWANAHTQVPSNSLAAIFEAHPIDTRMLLVAESSLVLGAIELFLGGSVSGGVVKDRRMTDIDHALGKHFFERLLGQLTMIWTDVAGLELKLDAVDQHMETAQMVPVSEPTLSLMMEARLQGTSATLALLIPWSAIAPVADSFGAREETRGNQNEEDRSSVRRAVGNVEMTLRAEVAAVEMPIEAVLALKEGDLLRLNAPASGGITLYADQVPVKLAKPGRSGSRRAVQVTGDRSRRALGSQGAVAQRAMLPGEVSQ
jgi:flagellar motor switch protein FliM